MHKPTSETKRLLIIETGGGFSAHPDMQEMIVLPGGSLHNYNSPLSFPGTDEISNLEKVVEELLSAKQSDLRIFSIQPDLWRLPVLKDSYDISPEDIDMISTAVAKYLMIGGPPATFAARAKSAPQQEYNIIITMGLGFIAKYAKEIEQKVSAFMQIFPNRDITSLKMLFMGGSDSISLPDSQSRKNLIRAAGDIMKLPSGIYIQSNSNYLEPSAAQNFYAEKEGGKVVCEIRSIPPIAFGAHDRGVANDINNYVSQADFGDVDLVGPKPITAFDQDACLGGAEFRPTPRDYASVEERKKLNLYGSIPDLSDSQNANYAREVRTSTWLSPIKLKGKNGQHVIVAFHTFADDKLMGTSHVRDKIIKPHLPEGTEFDYAEKSGNLVSKHCDLERGEFSWASIEARSELPVIHVVDKRLAEAIFATTNAGREASMVFNPSKAFAKLAEICAAKNDGMSQVIVADNLCKQRKQEAVKSPAL